MKKTTRATRLAVALATVAAPLSVAASTTPAPAQAGTVALYSTTFDSNVHNRINTYRTNKGLRALSKSSCLMTFAQARAKRMATNNEMVHYGGLSNVFDKCGGSSVGENIAAGFTSYTALVSAWYNSDTHRANMMRAKFRYGAVASYKSASGRVYTASLFLAP